MASLNGQTIASSYEQLLHTDTDGGGNGNTLVTIKDGDNGTTFGLKLATNKVEVIPSAADDANAFEVSKNDGTAVFTVNTSSPGFSLAGNATITTADNSDNIALISTDADANAGPNLSFWRNSGSPADNDLLGQINWYAENSAGDKEHMAQFYVTAMDVTEDTEDVRFVIQTILAGAEEQSRIELLPSETVINQDSNNIDFRVESDGNANMLFVNAGGNAVGVGTGTNMGKLSVQSGISSSSLENVITIHQATTGADKPAAALGIAIENGGEGTNAGSLTISTATAGSLGERVRINSVGHVGLKTSAPAGELHIHSGDGAVSGGLILENNRDANNNQFIAFRKSRLAVSDDETEGADYLGQIDFQGYANGAFAVGSRIYSYAEADWSSSQNQSALVFQTANGTTLSEQMRITGAGRVWFQAGSGSFKTSTIGSVDRLGMIDMYDDAGYNPVLHVMSDREDPDFSPLRLTGGHNNPSSASQCIWIDFHDGDGTHRGGIQNGSTADNPEFFNGGSDERIKTNIVNTATNGLQIINGLELKDFTVKEWYNGYSSDVKCDFVAQNAEEHFPNMVSEHKMKPKKEEFRQDFVDAGLEAVEVETALGTEEMFPVKCISHAALIPILVKALQEADNKVDALTARVEALEAS